VAQDTVYWAGSEVIQRTLPDGSRHRIVKTAQTADGLGRRLGELGWHVAIDEAGPFFWGLGTHGGELYRSPS